ncbi:TetR/AcrR family transcriptional regulator [Curvivirga sp.]|uniref:TetR/AcrR family transcriptional regulator n=1 Tax=Curvivirga sp. TaxID=2856848 RepID=UPI003B5A307C
MQNSKRQHIIESALPLFNEYGFHNTGVNLIMEKAGISKKTLYAHFRTKDDLIAAVLQYGDAVSRNNFMRIVDRSSEDPKEKLLAAFDATKDWFNQKDFFGCTFVNVIAEYSEDTSQIRNICQQSKKLKRDYLYEICLEANLKTPEALADKLVLLIEGATVTAQVSKSDDAANTAKMIAAQLIEAASQ